MTTVWVCLACGKVSKDRYGKEGTSQGWDESCFLNSAQVKEDHIVWGTGEEAGKVVEIKEGGIIEDEMQIDGKVCTG